MKFSIAITAVFATFTIASPLAIRDAPIPELSTLDTRQQNLPRYKVYFYSKPEFGGPKREGESIIDDGFADKCYNAADFGWNDRVFSLVIASDTECVLYRDANCPEKAGRNAYRLIPDSDLAETPFPLLGKPGTEGYFGGVMSSFKCLSKTK